MFVTFYSYKGGVGRSLALANIACLLAGDPQHPQRVLAWDFDLEAPGLHRLLPPSRPLSYGFVDLAASYASDGELPDVADYIYPSDVPGVDVLPAGRVGDSYCRTLESLDWAPFFTDDTGDPGPFFGPLIRAIRNLRYDYVLIDSRTGLGDQAGICTQVLPGLLVVLFRINAQNLDGLQHVVPTIQSQLETRGKSDVAILPVASAAASTTSPDLQRLVTDARRVFSTDRLYYIRFDADLAGRERLFCISSEQERFWPPPAVIDDYSRVCTTIRNHNAEDTRIASERLQHALARGDTALAVEMIAPLLRRRPRLENLWDTLHQMYVEAALPEKDARQLVESILEEDDENAFANRWRALQLISDATSPDAKQLREAVDLLEKVERSVTPRMREMRESVLCLLAHVNSVMGRLESMESVLRKRLELSDKNVAARIEIASLYVRMGSNHFPQALAELERIPEAAKKATWKLLAYLRALLGQPDRARDLIGKSTEEQGDEDWTRLVDAHVDLILGNDEEAVQKAEAWIGKEGSDFNGLNWAEFFLCARRCDQATEVARHASRSVLVSKGASPECMERLATYFSTGRDENRVQLLSAWSSVWTSWNFEELLFFRERMRKEGAVDLAERLGVVEDLIRVTRLAEPVFLTLGKPMRVSYGRRADWLVR